MPLRHALLCNRVVSACILLEAAYYVFSLVSTSRSATVRISPALDAWQRCIDDRTIDAPSMLTGWFYHAETTPETMRSSRCRRELQDVGIEASVQPNPALFVSISRFILF